MRSFVVAHLVCGYHIWYSPPNFQIRRLISGMHSSITAHIVGDYLLDEATNTWGPNMEMFKARLGNPWVRNRQVCARAWGCGLGEPATPTRLFVLRAAAVLLYASVLTSVKAYPAPSFVPVPLVWGPALTCAHLFASD